LIVTRLVLLKGRIHFKKEIGIIDIVEDEHPLASVIA
jgi:hypothetical protein